MNTDQRVIVVTDKYMYRLDPSKNFKSKKEHTLVTDIQTASITDQRAHDRVAELCANIHRVAIK
jgi:hypothetical protein